MFKKYLLSTILIMLTIISACNSDSGEEEIEIISAPILLDPSEITGSSFKISWLADSKATMHQIDVATDNSFTQLVAGFNARPVSGESFVITELNDNTEYFARVKSTLGEISSEYSATKTAATVNIPDPEPEIPLRTLTTVPIGAAVQAARLTGAYGQKVAAEHSSLTAEFEMKMEVIFKGKDEYDFGPGDAIVEFAEANDMQVHGHALVWHQSAPAFVENFAGTDEEFEEMIKDYIFTVVQHYKGQVVSWDVVNEAINDENGQLRNSVFRQKMGDDFVAKCFQFARQADPDVLLFYNDYSILFDQVKYNASLDLIKDMQDRNIDVDGIGFQSHIDINFPGRSTIAAALQKAVDLGLKVHISELDIKVNTSRLPNFVLDGESAQIQKEKYKEITEEFMKLPKENRFALTMWGIIDGESWLTNFVGAPEFPLLFNDDLSPKASHTGVAEVLQDIE